MKLDLKNISKYIVWLIDRNDDGLLRAAFSMLDKIIFQVDISKELKEENFPLRLERFFEKRNYLYPYYLLGNVFMLLVEIFPIPNAEIMTFL